MTLMTDGRDTADEADLVVVGGGLVGLATAYQFTERWPGQRVLVLEKEARVASHQSGRNSGVLHSGLYYRPHSAKARLCRRGRAAMLAFCEQHGVRHEVCGKVVVAVDDSERPALDELKKRAELNGVAARRLSHAELAEIEPHVRGVAALAVPEAGLVDYPAVAHVLAEQITERGGTIMTDTEVTGAERCEHGVLVQTSAGQLAARQLVTCAGLHADRVARHCGLDPSARIVPFRGEYRELAPEARELCRHMVYPVPDPALPFLGVHLTRQLDGGVHCGPNAVLAFAREGYTGGTVVARDLLEMATWPGFWRMAARNLSHGVTETRRSLSRRAFGDAVRRLVPAVCDEYLHGGHSGVRGQAVARDGALLDDFLIITDETVTVVVNAPSPAATACLAIGEEIVNRIAP